MNLETNWILSASEYAACQHRGDFPLDLSYEEYVVIRKEQQAAVAAHRAAMNPLDREILEYHEARRRRATEPAAA